MNFIRTRGRSHGVQKIGSRNTVYQVVLLILSGFFFFYLFFFWLRWVFLAARGLSLVAASGGYSSLLCAGFSLQWLLLLRSTGSRGAGSVVVARGL